MNITLEQYVQLRQKQYRFLCRLLMHGDLDPEERESIIQTIEPDRLKRNDYRYYKDRSDRSFKADSPWTDHTRFLECLSHYWYDTMKKSIAPLSVEELMDLFDRTPQPSLYGYGI